MIDEMTNPDLIQHVNESDSSTEIELELAHRLAAAIDEIEAMSQLIALLQATNGSDT